MRIINNSLWLILEKVVLSISALIINGYAAQYLGADQFGVISLILTLLSLCSVVAIFGTNTLLFQRVSKKSNSYPFIYPNVLIIRLFLFFISVLISYEYFNIINDGQNKVLYIGIVFSALFQILDTHACYFDARLKSKLNAICNIVSLVFALLCRFLIVKLSLSIDWFAMPYILNFLISYLLRVIIYRFSYHEASCLKIDKKVMLYMISFGLPLFMSEFSILMYSRLTNLYLNYFEGAESVGHFNAAISISISWVVIPTAIITSFFAVIYGERSSSKRFELTVGVTILITLIACVFAMFSIIFGEQVISVLYGDGYKESALIFKMLSLSTVFSLVGIVSYRFIISDGGYKYLAIKMIVMGVGSIPINYYFIKFYGLAGAAYSILCIEFLSATIGNYFFKFGVLFKVHSVGFLHPIKYFKLSFNVLRGY